MDEKTFEQFYNRWANGCTLPNWPDNELKHNRLTNGALYPRVMKVCDICDEETEDCVRIPQRFAVKKINYVYYITCCRDHLATYTDKNGTTWDLNKSIVHEASKQTRRPKPSRKK